MMSSNALFLVLMACCCAYPSVVDASYLKKKDIRNDVNVDDVDIPSWEPVHLYRERMNITYNYEPKYLRPEHCRYLSEEHCRADDMAVAEQHASYASNPRRLSPQFLSGGKMLLLLVRFTDHMDRELPDPSYYQDLCDNQMKPYLAQQSYGKYVIADCFVQGWMTTDNTEDYYAQGKSGLLGSADAQKFFHPVLNQLDAAGHDWSQYDSDGDGAIDGMIVFHSGYAAEFSALDCTNDRGSADRIFSQGHSSSPNGWKSSDGQWGLSGYAITAGLQGRCNANPARLGVPTHEFIHTLGKSTPDMYDPNNPGGGGIGGYDIMNQPFGSSGMNGHNPGSASPWTKKYIGWIEPTEIGNGVYTMRPSTVAPDIYMISDPYAAAYKNRKEYLLLEYRRPVDWDADFYGNGGMVIYHVDETMPNQRNRGWIGQDNWPRNGNHYMVAVLQADSNYDIEQWVNFGDAGDLYTPGMVIEQGKGWNFPNTDGYQGGEVRKIGLMIEVLSMDETQLEFKVSGLQDSYDINISGEDNPGTSSGGGSSGGSSTATNGGETQTEDDSEGGTDTSDGGSETTATDGDADTTEGDAIGADEATATDGDTATVGDAAPTANTDETETADTQSTSGAYKQNQQWILYSTALLMGVLFGVVE